MTTSQTEMSTETFTEYFLCNAHIFMLLHTNNLFAGWLEWKSVFTRFIPVGLCLLTVMQWRAYRRQCNERTARQWEISCYCMLPLRTVSRYWGWIAGIFIFNSFM